MNNYRDKEIKRLEQYCKGLGLKVSYKKKTRKDPEAEWVLDGSEIVIYLSSKLTKVQLILNIIHELGHHFDYVYNNRKIQHKVNYAWGKENNNEEMTENQRYVIYEDEYNASLFRAQIIHELNLKISKERLEFDIEMDLFVYYTFYKTGNYPVYREIAVKKKELLKKFNLEKRKKNDT